MSKGNEIELRINQKCLDNLKSLNSLRDEDLYLRAVSFLHFLGSESKKLPNGWKFCSIALFRKFHYEFDSRILPELLQFGFCHLSPKRKGYNASEFILEFDYETREPFKIALPEYEAAKWRMALDILDDKKRAAGYWINTRENIQIDFPRSTKNENVLLEYKKDRGANLSGDGLEEAQKNIQYQFSIIERINSGEVLETRKSQGRAYSVFSELSKPISSRVYDNQGNRFISCDQHATYFTILPKILKTLTSDSGRLAEINSLRQFIIDSPKIYGSILLAMKSMHECEISEGEIKNQAISWLCDQNKISKTRKLKGRDALVKQEMEKWFSIAFPECCKLVNENRKGAFLSRRIAEEESKIFCGASKMLNRLGVPCLYKFDEILVIERDLDLALELLDFFFKKTGVPNRVKTDNGRQGVKISIERFEELQMLWESLWRLRKPQSVREYLANNQDRLKEIMRESHRNEENEEGTEQPLQVEFQKSRTSQKISSIKPFRQSRFRCSYLGKDYYSTKSETEIIFRIRMEAIGAKFQPPSIAWEEVHGE